MYYCYTLMHVTACHIVTYCMHVTACHIVTYCMHVTACHIVTYCMHATACHIVTYCMHVTACHIVTYCMLLLWARRLEVEAVTPEGNVFASPRGYHSFTTVGSRWMGPRV